MVVSTWVTFGADCLAISARSTLIRFDPTGASPRMLVPVTTTSSSCAGLSLDCASAAGAHIIAATIDKLEAPTLRVVRLCPTVYIRCFLPVFLVLPALYAADFMGDGAGLSAQQLRRYSSL